MAERQQLYELQKEISDTVSNILFILQSFSLTSSARAEYKLRIDSLESKFRSNDEKLKKLGITSEDYFESVQCPAISDGESVSGSSDYTEGNPKQASYSLVSSEKKKGITLNDFISTYPFLKYDPPTGSLARKFSKEFIVQCLLPIPEEEIKIFSKLSPRDGWKTFTEQYLLPTFDEQRAISYKGKEEEEPLFKKIRKILKEEIKANLTTSDEAEKQRVSMMTAMRYLNVQLESMGNNPPQLRVSSASVPEQSR